MRFVIAVILQISLLLTAEISKADHHVAMDLTYKPTGVFPDQYEITLTFYRDCDGMATPFSVDVCFRSVQCAFLGSVTLNRISGPTLVPWPGCVVYPGGNNGCAGGGVYGVQKSVFKGTVILPYQCTDWEFEYVQCCRNYDITTVANAGTENFYLHATLDNFNVSANSTPVFSTIPAVVWCVGNTLVYDPGVTEADGDSLVFELHTPQALSNMVICDPANPSPYDVLYNPPYSAQAFISSSTGVNLDPATGVITCTPNLIQTTIVDLVVKEYRNGVLIGTVTRDLQFHISPLCNTVVPQFITGVVNGTPDATEADCGDTFVILPTDYPVKCASAEISGSDFLALDIAGNPLPITSVQMINCASGISDSVRINFSQPLQQGVSKVWTKNGLDGNTLLSECGNQMLINDTVNIVVINGCVTVQAIFSASDSSFCQRTCVDFYDMSTNNPTSWSWYFPGASDTLSSQQNPAQICYNNPGTFDVQLIACNATGCDTILMTAFVTANAFPVLNLSIWQSNDTIYASPAPNYQWYLDGAVVLGATGNFIVVSQPGNYSVITYDPTSECQLISNMILVTSDHGFDLNAAQLLVTPNPFRETFEISITSNVKESCSILLTDVTGRIIQSMSEFSLVPGINKIQIAPMHCSAGLYLLQILTAESRIVQRVMCETY